MIRNATLPMLFSVGVLLSGCGQPKPPPQARQLSPDVMSAQINALDAAQKQNEAAAYQYYQQQQARAVTTQSIRKR